MALTVFRKRSKPMGEVDRPVRYTLLQSINYTQVALICRKI
jgi:hypothetical protein